MITVFYFILALIALGVLVFIHELGHYFVARWVGMRVEIFSIGFGKPLVKWKWKGVDWQLAMLPFGGFVKIAGMEFGKKENNEAVDPYAIPGGFFASAPFKRILVAIAGPLSNFILAFLLFCVLYLMGGREKPFSEYTKIIGWVDPQSEAYHLGLRPGDEILSFNGKRYTNSKDLIYATLDGGKHVELQGFHVDYVTGEKTPYTYTIKPYLSPLAIDDVYVTGINSGASYLIYDTFPDSTDNKLAENAPALGSGLQYGDRIVWADGSLIFSLSNLSHLINDNTAFLTVKRGNEIFSSRQKRYLAVDLALPTLMRNELTDWTYEAGMRTKWQQLSILPYMLSNDGIVTGTLTFLDDESKNAANSAVAFSKQLELKLQSGDQIIAVDGIAVTKASQILNLLQTKRVNVIVERNTPVNDIESSAVADKTFIQSIDAQEIAKIASTIGMRNLVTKAGNYVLLKPIEPMRVDEFMSAELKALNQSNYDEKRQKIESVSNPDKKLRMLQILAQENKKYVLGIDLQDRKVEYNPTPVVAMWDVVKETWITLKALIFGYLNPKWLSGPIGIVQVIQRGWNVGVGEALFWIAAISVNLGVLNLLPIPILDGGYICLSLWEMITKRRLKTRTMERLIVPFVVLLIGLLIFLTFQDISRFF